MHNILKMCLLLVFMPWCWQDSIPVVRECSFIIIWGEVVHSCMESTIIYPAYVGHMYVDPFVMGWAANSGVNLLLKTVKMLLLYNDTPPYHDMLGFIVQHVPTTVRLLIHIIRIMQHLIIQRLQAYTLHAYMCVWGGGGKCWGDQRFASVHVFCVVQ